MRPTATREPRMCSGTSKSMRFRPLHSSGDAAGSSAAFARNQLPFPQRTVNHAADIISIEQPCRDWPDAIAQGLPA